MPRRERRRGESPGSAGDPGIYGPPGHGQTHRDAPLSPRGELIWSVIFWGLGAIVVGVVAYAVLSS